MNRRIKSTLIVLNEAVTPHRTLSAVVMRDGGARRDRVFLSARTTLQLGLTPVPRGSGGVVTIRCSDNTLTTKLLFAPHDSSSPDHTEHILEI